MKGWLLLFPSDPHRVMVVFDGLPRPVRVDQAESRLLLSSEVRAVIMPRDHLEVLVLFHPGGVLVLDPEIGKRKAILDDRQVQFRGDFGPAISQLRAFSSVHPAGCNALEFVVENDSLDLAPGL